MNGYERIAAMLETTDGFRLAEEDLRIRGQGTVFFNAYGAVVEKQVNGAMVVDTGHLVAFEPTLQYQIRGMGGLKQTLLSGEGLVMKFEGVGKIYLQTRHLSGLVGWLTPFCR